MGGFGLDLCLCLILVGVWIASHGWFWFRPVFVSDISRCMYSVSWVVLV